MRPGGRAAPISDMPAFFLNQGESVLGRMTGSLYAICNFPFVLIGSAIMMRKSAWRGGDMTLISICAGAGALFEFAALDRACFPP